MPLSREPWPGGYRPVRIVACDGSVTGAAAYARSNTAPDPASSSTNDACEQAYPYTLTWSARIVSIVTCSRLRAVVGDELSDPDRSGDDHRPQATVAQA